MQKLCCVCTRQQFSASLDYFVTSSPPYLHQFSTISGGNCINPLQETAEALANLATATASDHQALQNLTNTVKELSNLIKAKDQQIKDLIKAMSGNKPMGYNPRSTRWEKKDCGSYCHTHGYLVGQKHTSETCRQPGPNHNKNAT